MSIISNLDSTPMHDRDFFKFSFWRYLIGENFTGGLVVSEPCCKIPLFSGNISSLVLALRVHFSFRTSPLTGPSLLLTIC